MSSSHCLEGPAIEAVSKLANIVPAGNAVGPRAYENAQLAEGELKSWLDEKHTQSVLLVCFGYVCFPSHRDDGE